MPDEEVGPMVIIAGYTLVDEGQRDAYVEAHSKLVKRARASEGCIDAAITAESMPGAPRQDRRGPASSPPRCRCGDSTPKTVARSSGPRGRAGGGGIARRALMTWADRWGGAAETYPDFARGYGADLRQSSLAQELTAPRLLAPTINMIINGASNPGEPF
jgi:hypothetical protein